MTSVRWQDMSAVVRLGMKHLAQRVGDKPVHIIGYSTGAALALDYALQAEAGTAQPTPASLVLISPAIAISPAAALAKWKRRLSLLPGLDKLAWLEVQPEFDPYKYNSFATNAAEQVHSLTSWVASRIESRANSDKLLPPILVLKSTVDATVSTTAVVDRLLLLLAPNRHEMVLFDINRFAATSSLLVDDPGPLTARLIADDKLPFGLTLVANTDTDSRSVSAQYKAPYSGGISRSEPLGLEWSNGIFSLSHVALPFPPDDPLYGRQPPADRNELFLGQQAVQGERGLLQISGDFLLRLRHNPFYDYLEKRVLDWVDPHGK
jgi:alpha-beta hydrolase superfamily lysophospholipase